MQETGRHSLCAHSQNGDKGRLQSLAHRQIGNHTVSHAQKISPFELIQNQQIPDRQAGAGKKSG
jgi:hypothetical protein